MIGKKMSGKKMKKGQKGKIGPNWQKDAWQRALGEDELSGGWKSLWSGGKPPEFGTKELNGKV